MRKSLYLLFAAFVFFSCGEEKEEGVLSSPPFKALTDSIERSPSDAGLYYRRGVMLYGRNFPEQAEQDLRKAWQLQPEESYALSLTTLLRQKSTDSALTFLQQASQKLPQSIAVKIGIARAYEQKKQADQALAICEQIIDQYPGQLDALLLKAELLKEQNRQAEAIATLEKAYSYAPDDVELVHTLAFDYAESGNPKTLALADSLIRVDVEASHAEPYYFKGVYYSNKGNQAEAIRQFDAAISHNYNFMNAHINKGIVFYEQKAYQKAAKAFELAIAISPSDADPYYWLARAQEAMNDKASARLNYQRAYELDKTMTKAAEAAKKL
ncbi:MAG TPA: tetratricopeptide repeat protein [Flavisolibacter sp.]|nr:tetratricopeptide repeat protein [Flavisolibacter sp.]